MSLTHTHAMDTRFSSVSLTYLNKVYLLAGRVYAVHENSQGHEYDVELALLGLEGYKFAAGMRNPAYPSEPFMEFL
jgi:hypothetical protein